MSSRIEDMEELVSRIRTIPPFGERLQYFEKERPVSLQGYVPEEARPAGMDGYQSLRLQEPEAGYSIDLLAQDAHVDPGQVALEGQVVGRYGSRPIIRIEEIRYA